MTSDAAVAVLTGAFALGGGLGGVLLSNVLAKRARRTDLQAADDRRWLVDRRTVYAHFLGLSEAMLREIDGLAVFLSYDGTEPMRAADEELVAGGLLEYFGQWDEELQPALGEVQLLATPSVADLADRMSGALMELTAVVELRRPFSEHYPVYFQARDLLEVLRDAMRTELGVTAMGTTSRVSDDWPWLPDRPSRQSYVQDHGSAKRNVRRESDPSGPVESQDDEN